MRAWVVDRSGPIDSQPLPPVTWPAACGVCRTDLHLAEGDLAPRRRGVVPGHEVVGVVDALGADCTRASSRATRAARWARKTAWPSPTSPMTGSRGRLCSWPERRLAMDPRPDWLDRTLVADIDAELRSRATPERAGKERAYPEMGHDELVALADGLWAAPVHQRRMVAVELLDLYGDRLEPAAMPLLERRRPFW